MMSLCNASNYKLHQLRQVFEIFSAKRIRSAEPIITRRQSAIVTRLVPRGAISGWHGRIMLQGLP
jgi:hypothetical protein